VDLLAQGAKVAQQRVGQAEAPERDAWMIGGVIIAATGNSKAVLCRRRAQEFDIAAAVVAVIHL
jgi:hypothetical protein